MQYSTGTTVHVVQYTYYSTSNTDATYCYCRQCNFLRTVRTGTTVQFDSLFNQLLSHVMSHFVLNHILYYVLY